MIFDAHCLAVERLLMKFRSTSLKLALKIAFNDFSCW